MILTQSALSKERGRGLARQQELRPNIREKGRSAYLSIRYSNTRLAEGNGKLRKKGD